MAFSFDKIMNSLYGEKKLAVKETQDPIPDEIIITPEYERVLELIQSQDSQVIFVTGGAGSGKSTLIRHIVKTSLSFIPIVAPTGIAALTVGGQTIHSFFKIPVIDDDEVYSSQALTTTLEKQYDWTLFSKINLVIIDEISMVRCDLLDAVDHVLRSVTKRDRPFGGIKMLFVGDLLQLPPVKKKTTLQKLQAKGYQDMWFFNAKCLRGQTFESIELESSFRHKDDIFLRLLNNIRKGENLQPSVDEINRKCFEATLKNHVLTVTSINKDADEINISNLRKIAANTEEFTAIAEGTYKIPTKNGEPDDRRLPSPYRLELKVGAMVMFTKNDIAKRWVNGTIGKVTGFDKENNITTILVNAPVGSNVIHRVNWEKWETMHYEYDYDLDKVKKVTTGAYVQYPLRLAWAITIHKCQSLTLDSLAIDLGSGAFEKGQTYVALSRCTSLEGISLKRKLTLADVKISNTIIKFYKTIRELRELGEVVGVVTNHLHK